MYLLFCLLVVVAAIVLLAVKWKFHPFLSLLFGAIIMGFLAGITPLLLVETITEGFGNTLRSIGIVIAAGALIGEYLDRSGGAHVLANKILNVVGEKNAPLSMSMTGYVVSIPVFCDSGFIVLSALNKAIGKRTGISLAVLTVALASGLYTTHVFVPPTPGPIAAAATLGANVGWVLILGLVVSVPVMMTALYWANRYCRHYEITYEIKNSEEKSITTPPSFSIAIAPILGPILLIGLKSVAEYPTYPFGEKLVYSMLSFLGEPVIALLIGVILAFGMIKGGADRLQNKWLEEALKKAGVIILITGAGGAFGEVLRETDLGNVATNVASIDGMGILIPFLVAAFLKSAQGSSTVAIITSAAIISPLVNPMGLDIHFGKELAVLAIGAGSLTVSHVNDSYFWVVAKFSNMDTATALKTHTIATFIMGVTGLITLQIMAWVIL